ncbi:MAG: ATP-binding cassette domain-containing protein [Fibromonadaceae bacterium]|jgi:ABC-type transport system involved in cytochrome bd biosynthesis fused ATPase/permease subunit|nr:ATP-binding cassette domain-containing protein [Fibromonadaceae bacterium]
MRKFIPEKYLAFTILCECFSRGALIFALFQIPHLAVKFSNTRISFFLAAIFLFAVFHFFSQKISMKLGSKAKKKIRIYFQNKFLSAMPIQDRAQKGMPLQELSLHYMKTADLMEPWYSRFLPSAGIAVIVPCIILCVMFFLDKLTFIILFFTGLLLPVFLFLIGKVAKRKSEEQWQSFSKLKAFFLESLQGFKTIKIFKKVKERERDLEAAENEFGKKTFAVLKTAFLSALVQEWAAALSIALVAVSLAVRLLNGSMEFGTAFLALLITPEFYRPIRQFGLAFHAAMDAKTAWKAVAIRAAARVAPTVAPTITARQLFIPKQKSLLYITGPSGCGKTRMVLEMLGHESEQIMSHIPNNETLHVACPMSQTSDSAFSKLKLVYNGNKNDIAWMPQNPVWFKGTLWDNLCPVERREFPEVKAALEKVNLGHFTKRLNEPVLEYANNFSGGEKRRLALARVILLNRPVWILDEPFAGLDKDNVRLIEKLLEKESETKSILCISHHFVYYHSHFKREVLE